jgi:CO dehydrogenase/acetyl-CoA synthase beta subunit
MSLLKKQISEITDFLADKEASNELTELDASGKFDWPFESTLVLSEQTALELGNPKDGSLIQLFFSDDKKQENDQVLLIGPDIPDIETKSAPLGIIVLVNGTFDDEYECYRDMKDSVYDARLKGVMTRVMPSKQTIWDRINDEALESGLSLAHIGAAYLDNLREFDFVRDVTVLFITSSKKDIDKISPVCYEAGRIIGALVKMNEEMDYDCDSCDYSDVCDDVAELKRVRAKLKKED